MYKTNCINPKTTINTLEKTITLYEIPLMKHENGTCFINSDFVNWTKGFGLILGPRTTYSPRTNGTVVQNHFTRYGRNFKSESGDNWSRLAPQCAFAHKTSVNYTTGLTPYEIVFGTKLHFPMTLKLGLFGDRNKQFKSEYCDGL